MDKISATFAGRVTARLARGAFEHLSHHAAKDASHTIGSSLQGDSPREPQSAPPYLKSLGVEPPSPAVLLAAHSALFSPSARSQQAVFQFPPPMLPGTPRPAAPSLSSGVESTPASATGPRS